MTVFTISLRAAPYRPITEFEPGEGPFLSLECRRKAETDGEKTDLAFFATSGENHLSMSIEEAFVQTFARLLVHYREALTLDIANKQLRSLNEMQAVELDRMISAARLALLEIEGNAREQDGAHHYYSRADRTIAKIR